MSVGKAYAVLAGRMTGDSQTAKRFLSGLSEAERVMRNRNESRTKARRRTFVPGRRLGYR